MDKWADYGISAVSYDKDHEHIERVEIRKDNGDKFGQAEIHPRQNIIKAIEAGTTFVTIVNDGQNWNKGSEVFVITVNGRKFIKTKSDNTEADNLENLPEF